MDFKWHVVLFQWSIGTLFMFVFILLGIHIWRQYRQNLKLKLTSKVNSGKN